MSEFYFTFGQRYRREPHPKVGHVAHPDGYFIVDAENEEAARLKMAEACGLFWAGCYIEKPSADMYPLGELKRL